MFLAWEFLPLAILVALKLVLHLYANSEYGFHRDELAYIDDGKRLAWGYVDHPPIAPLLAAAARMVWPDTSVLGLRLLPAVASTLLLGITCLMARELGGGRLAMFFAGIAFIGAPVFLASGVLMQTVTFDLLWWGLLSLSYIRLAKTDDARWWLAIGALAGLALLTKYTAAFYLASFSLAMLATPARAHLRTPYPYIAAAIALLIFLPNLVWQAQHDFVVFDYTDAINQRDQAMGRTGDFFPEQLLLLGPAAVFLWGLGLAWLFRSGDAKAYRALGWTFVSTVVLFAVFQGRGYYTAAVYPPLFAAGGVAIERLNSPRLLSWLRVPFAAVLAGGAAFAASVSLPLASTGSGYFEFASDLNEDLPEMVGWPELVGTIAVVRDGLPASERADAAVLAGNYGEAGAVNLYGPRYGLPRAISPVNSYYEHSKGRLDAPVYIVVGFDQAELRTLFRSVEVAAPIQNRDEVENEETTRHRFVYLCRDPIRPLSDAWESLRAFS